MARMLSGSSMGGGGGTMGRGIGGGTEGGLGMRVPSLRRLRLRLRRCGRCFGSGERRLVGVAEPTEPAAEDAARLQGGGSGGKGSCEHRLRFTREARAHVRG